MPADDRRSRRSRAALRRAFVSLVLERSYSSVTVEDIANRADVGRATFYSHYTDKEALFDQIVDDLLTELSTRVRPLVPASSMGFTGRPVYEIFRHAQEERDTYRIVLRGEGDGRGLRKFVEFESARAAQVFQARSEFHGAEPRVRIDLLARAWVGELVAVLSWFLETDREPLPAEEAAQMLRILALKGRYWASGLDEPPGEEQMEVSAP